MVDDYRFNISSSSTTLNWTTFDIEFITQPLIPIQIYFPNATLYTSCSEQCIIRQCSLPEAYVIRLTRLLRARQAINYTLFVQCSEAYIETTYLDYMETEFDYSVSFNQQLTFRNRGNILSFGTVMVLWMKGGLYFWTVMQLSFIFLGTIYSAFYIDDYYFIADDMTKSEDKKTKESERAKRLFWGRMLTFIGLGRVYHSILGWDEARNKDMEISDRVLKVWEMIFESFPSIVLQTWISLYTNLDVNIVLSLFVGMASLTYSFWSVLYGDHNSPTRQNELIIAQRIHSKRKVAETLTGESHSSILDEPQPSSADHDTSDQCFNSSDIDAGTIRKQYTSAFANKACTGEQFWRNFICFYPIEVLRSVCANAYVSIQSCIKPNEKEEPKQQDQERFTTRDKVYYFVFYVWVMTDFGIRIFPILACARLRQQYYEFLAVMIGLTVFEFFSYYYMLSQEYTSPRSALHFFWTLYFTISYCLLSSMHVVYLPNNVEFDKLIVENICRMIIQAVFMVFAMVLQLNEYGSVLGFFHRSIYVFWFVWLFNWGLMFLAKKGFNELKSKIEMKPNIKELELKSKNKDPTKEAIEVHSDSGSTD